MTNTDILLEDLEDVLDDATSMPMTKKSLVDVEKIKTIIEDIRLKQSRQRQLLIQETQFLMKHRRMQRQLLQKQKHRQESLLHAIRLHRRLRLKLLKFLQGQEKRVKPISVMLRHAQVKFWAMPLHRQMICLLLHRRIKKILSMRLIIMQRIPCLLLMMLCIKHFRM